MTEFMPVPRILILLSYQQGASAVSFLLQSSLFSAGGAGGGAAAGGPESFASAQRFDVLGSDVPFSHLLTA